MEGLGRGRYRGCWAGKGLVWGGTGQKGVGGDLQTVLCLWQQQGGGHSAANSSNTNTDSSCPCSCGCSFGAKETSPDTADSSMAHNIRATERWPPLLTAHAEELFEDKETAQDTPTTAAPHDCWLFSGQYPGQGYHYHPRDGRLKAKG